ncbi:helix-turn-helix domain-containing protein [Myroides guanonis]|uniref:AraC-type DNA-binding protein n=1 Tax=Myroides guanonis TaxID=1150112 RepID=A0A1I3UY07_9FLAO|nr:AraC family transcriptional regulator [Myroides guanonis]SFJ87925.1 AraC-type DNA-binding protein [Myroides guanonis]
MFDHKQLLSLIFLFGVLVFTIYNSILFKRQKENNHIVFKALYCFNFFIMFHAILSFTSNLIFDDRFFLDLGDPLALFYAPFYILILKLESGNVEKINRKFWFYNFSLGILFSIVFCLLIFNSYLYQLYVAIYVKVLFGVIGVQMIAYAVWGMLLIQKNRVVGNKTRVWNLFFDGLIVICITGTFFFTGIHKVNELLVGDIESNVYIVHLFMLLASIIIHRVFDKRFQFNSTAFKKEDFSSSSLIEKNVSLEDKYSKSRIDAELLKVYAHKIGSLESDYFLRSDLNIEKMALDLKISTHHLSQVFSIAFETNYSQYVNKQRVLFALSLLQDQILLEVDKKKSISEIAFLSGFNSDSSFYRAFKDSYGLSPIQWVKKEETNKLKSSDF